MILVLAFGGAYVFINPVKVMVDKGLNPGVNALTNLYGKISTFIFQKSQIDLGFVTFPEDSEFLFNVQLATYINQRRAGPLLDMAVNGLLPQDQRQRALLSLLKFESTSDWIQPFLNELPRGGMLNFYNEEIPEVDALIKKIRSEGGVRQPLVRAYAEVCFSFMLQLPTLVVRRHATKWLSDVLAEDAIFLLIPRFNKEKEPLGQKEIEKALYDIRAVSEREPAINLLVPYFKKPSWPSLRLPVAVVLTRLGYAGVAPYIQSVLQSEGISKEERHLLTLAQSLPKYPNELTVSENDKRLMAERRQMRADQIRLALERHEEILRQEQVKKALISRSMATTGVLEEPQKRENPVSVATKVSTKEPILPKQVVAMAPAVVAPLIPKTAPVLPIVVPPQKQPVPVPVPEVVKTPPPSIVQEPVVIAPPVDQSISKSRSLMNYVDIVFEVKDQAVPLFKNPGELATGVVLPVGSKGKGDFEVIIGEDHWYQVQTKKGDGWANGKNLSLFNLSPEGVVPAVASTREKPGGLDEERKEATYFEAAAENLPLFEKSSDKSKRVGVLEMDVPYLAIRSEKIGPDRWFLLQIRSGETAWSMGTDLRLSEVQQPGDINLSHQALSQQGKKSAFTAQWVKSTVKGVGVYNRPSITAKMVGQINPPTIYQVLSVETEGGKEWYRIELPGKKEGYVQSMDVSLTKPE